MNPEEQMMAEQAAAQGGGQGGGGSPEQMISEIHQMVQEIGQMVAQMGGGMQQEAEAVGIEEGAAMQGAADEETMLREEAMARLAQQG